MFLISVYYYYKCNSNYETTFECQSRSHELDSMKPFVKVVKFIVLGPGVEANVVIYITFTAFFACDNITNHF